jgi:hypothetical protein
VCGYRTRGNRDHYHEKLEKRWHTAIQVTELKNLREFVRRKPLRIVDVAHFFKPDFDDADRRGLTSGYPC